MQVDAVLATTMVIAGTLVGVAAGYLFHEVVVAGYSRAVDSLARDQLLELAERRRPGRITEWENHTAPPWTEHPNSALVTQDLGYDLSARVRELRGIPTWWEY